MTLRLSPDDLSPSHDERNGVFNQIVRVAIELTATAQEIAQPAGYKVLGEVFVAPAVALLRVLVDEELAEPLTHLIALLEVGFELDQENRSHVIDS
jgi:hypothetical protein